MCQNYENWLAVDVGLELGLDRVILNDIMQIFC